MDVVHYKNLNTNKKTVCSCLFSTAQADSECKSAHTGFTEGLQTSDTAGVCEVFGLTVRPAAKTSRRHCCLFSLKYESACFQLLSFSLLHRHDLIIQHVNSGSRVL